MRIDEKLNPLIKLSNDYRFKRLRAFSLERSNSSEVSVDEDFAVILDDARLTVPELVFIVANYGVANDHGRGFGEKVVLRYGVGYFPSNDLLRALEKVMDRDKFLQFKEFYSYLYYRRLRQKKSVGLQVKNPLMYPIWFEEMNQPVKIKHRIEQIWGWLVDHV